jgi:uncharacterized protein (TIGR02147 family)
MEVEISSAQNILLQEFNRRVRVNARYSLRAYARALGLSSGALSEILRGQRPISLKGAVKISKALGLGQAEAKKFYEAVETQKRSALSELAWNAPPPRPLDRKQLDEDAFHLVSEWYHFAILNLMDCEGFRWQARYIARRLGVSISQAQMAMGLLLRMGLVARQEEQVRASQDFVLSPSGISSAAIRKYHRQMLEKASQALELQKVSEREMTGIGFAIDPGKVDQIKKEMADFQDQIIAKYSKGKKHEVYFLEMALFRITKGDVNGSN